MRTVGIGLATLFAVPLIVGLIGSLLPALGFMPQLAPGNGFEALFNDARFWPAIWLSVKTGFIATALVLAITVLTLVCAHGTRLWRWLMGLLPPLLAVPHAAMAVGLVFLIAPSGWLVRLVSPALSTWERPPDYWIVPDGGGWSLIIGLLIKEAPFLLLAAAAQLATINVSESLTIGRTLGYAPARCWSRLVLPRLYKRIRLTLLIILAFNLSVVDMAILLGPGNPPTFSVFLLSLVNQPESRAAASAGALILALLVLASFVLVFIIEWCVAQIALRRRESGQRGQALAVFRSLGKGIVVSVVLMSILSMLMLVLWSFTQRWRFPDTLPSKWTLNTWLNRTDLLTEPLFCTLLFGLFTLVSVVVAAIAWLECERRSKVPRMDWMWYIPLLIPQVTLLFGWQAAALYANVDGVWLTVAYAHWVYAMPYAVLILAVAWRELDPVWSHAAGVLGAGYWKILFRVRLPLLIKPIMQAAAVALAVSVAQYLPTLLLGAGRHQTLAIELVTSFGGVDRRVIATLAALQSILPLIAFILALTLPHLFKPATMAQAKRMSS